MILDIPFSISIYKNQKGEKIMAKITQLPKATAVTDSDIAVIVQDGETRQIQG